MRDLANSVAKLANAWMRRSGSSLKVRDRLHAVDAAVGNAGMSTEDRVLRAAACDLHDVLCALSKGMSVFRLPLAIVLTAAWLHPTVLAISC